MRLVLHLHTFVLIQVIAIPGNFGPCEPLEERNVIIAEPFDGAKPFQNANEMKDKVTMTSER